MHADLAQQESIRAFVDAFTRTYGSLEVLSCNAATLLPKRQVTSDGLEKTLAVNYLSHFLLVSLHFLG